VIQEPTCRMEWDPRLSGCELLTARPIGKGTYLRTFYGLLGWIDLDYVSWQAPARSAVTTRATSRGNVVHSVIGSWNLLTHDDNSTTWKTQLLVRATGGRWLAPLLERLLIGPMLGWFTALSARKLKQLVRRVPSHRRRSHCRLNHHTGRSADVQEVPAHHP
jgi:hypothetical protein